MARNALVWKVYTAVPRKYVAATKHPEEAGMLVSAMGAGAQIKYEHHTPVWTEGEEEQPAGESYEFVADTCNRRVNEQREKARRDYEAQRSAHQERYGLPVGHAATVSAQVDPEKAK